MVCRDGQVCHIQINLCLRGKNTNLHDILLLSEQTSGYELYEYVEEQCQIQAGTFKLFLLSGRNLFDLSEMKDKTMSEVGVDFSYDCERREGKHTLLVVSPEDTLSQKRSEYGLTVNSSNKSSVMTEDMYNDLFEIVNNADSKHEEGVPTVGIVKPGNYKYHRVFGKSEPKEEYNVKFQDFSKSETNYVGLVNQAMTCYLNSLLQALYMTPEFRNALYNWEYVDGSESDEAFSIPYQLQKLFLNLQTSTKSAVETTSLTKSFGWDSTEAWQQHDIQELCRVMFDALEQKFKNTEQADLINRLYEGKMIDYVKCLECCTIKSREDTFLDIPLPVRPFGSNVAYNSVEEAIRAFVQHETLEGSNQYHCEKCNKKCDAHKGLKFTKFPYLLTLHLKRFDFDFKTFHRIKLNDKVTFPDTLNLNSFISPRTNTESPCCDEDLGLGVKCDDSSTTDSGTLDDDCPPCENSLSNSNHSTTHDPDDDEGIDMNNGPSTSNYSTHNHENEKNHGNSSAKGPYIYELFSIMIHSGSASGGHYYAHIKDFRTQEWLSFNDQSVTQITYDDIQKTYGGGPTRPYYSGTYSSSTNAYMLMYRQIDPARNVLPMQAEDFPKHIQKLLKTMKENEDKKSYNRKDAWSPVLKIYCHHPAEGQLVNTKLLPMLNETLEDITERAYKKFELGKVVELNQCRLVLYNARTNLITCTYEGREQETITNIRKRKIQGTFLLEIRHKGEKFKSYLSTDIKTNVYVIDVAKKEVVNGPIDVPALLTQTVKEYKQTLRNIIGIDPKQMKLVLKISPYPKYVENDDNELQAEGFHNSVKVFVSVISDDDQNPYLEWSMLELIPQLDNVISINIDLPDTSKEILEEMNIPSLEEIYKEKERQKEKEREKEEKEKEKEKETEKDKEEKKEVKKEEEKEKEKEGEKEKEKEKPVSNSPSKLSVSDPPNDSPKCNVTEETEENCDDTPCVEHVKKTNSLSTRYARNISPQLAETEEWNTPEQSNSEDSSLSDSDKTLVGEVPEKDELKIPVLFERFLYFSDKGSRETYEIEDSDDDENSEFYFKVTHYILGDLRMLKVLIDKRMSLGTLKENLVPHIGVPAKYFRVFRLSEDSEESECTSLSEQFMSFKDDERLILKLGRALRRGEFKVKLYQFFIDSPEPYRFLCEWIIAKGMPIGQMKKEILAEIKRKYDIDIPYERCRLRKKFFKVASSVFLDNRKFDSRQFFYSQIEIIIQELPGEEIVTDSEQVILFVRRWLPEKMQLERFQEVVMDGQSLKELRKKISAISDIPEEYIEIAKAKQDALPFEMSVLRIQSDLDWSEYTSDVTSVNIKDGYIFLYRDKRENLKTLTCEEEKEIATKEMLRLIPLSSTLGSSARKEKGLVIHLAAK